MDNVDLAVRTAAFRFLEEQLRLAGEDGALRRDLLSRGFAYDGRRVPLLGPQGIFKPKILRSVS
jgi:putative restriction endonuclease